MSCSSQWATTTSLLLLRWRLKKRTGTFPTTTFLTSQHQSVSQLAGSCRRRRITTITRKEFCLSEQLNNSKTTFANLNLDAGQPEWVNEWVGERLNKRRTKEEEEEQKKAKSCLIKWLRPPEYDHEDHDRHQSRRLMTRAEPATKTNTAAANVNKQGSPSSAQPRLITRRLSSRPFPKKPRFEKSFPSLFSPTDSSREWATVSNSFRAQLFA